MSTVPSYFKDFLSNIRLTDNQVRDLKTGHTTLRKRLEEDETLSEIIVSTFLQGSYRRSTAVKPKNGNKSDVDVIVVTKLDSEEYTPEEALNMFIPFLDKYYKDKYRIQGRSIGISLSYVDLDIVPTSAPSESETGILQDNAIISEYTIEDFQQKSLMKSFDKNLFESVYNIFCESDSEPQWKSEPLLIPDREAEKWDETHPLEQIRWTVEKNKNCNSHYINVVKALKWWRKTQYPDVKHPKSYPLEHLIGDCCPDGINSVAEGIVLTLEKIVAEHPTKPFLADRGVPEHDVFERITDDEYSDFYDTVCDAAIVSREAFDCTELYDSVCKWRELLGSEFPPAPEPSKTNSTTGFTARTEKSTAIPEGRFA
ncbi:SMODS domain-containing nucleotidyltransferase [Brassicibacter mesophilus]|uniref:SMODS domain-containing nucleotidyltransferase n=1 Tax=Brassicibacter mesophilus TaxID=745119 RepID=UPI003D222A8C